MPKISIWETGRSQPAAICVSGGVVINVPAGIRMSGWPLSVIGRDQAVSALIAPTTVCASITRS